MQLQNVKIIISRASESGNVGAICRVIKNMGLSELRLAAPQPLILEDIYTRAVNAWDIWEKTRIFGNLNEAVADCSIVIGTSRRRGHNRKNVSMTPRALAEWLAAYPEAENLNAGVNAAIVFGNERTGLEDNELNLCNFASHIPVCELTQSGSELQSKSVSRSEAISHSEKAQPSLNLSHAVQIYAYELFLAMYEQRPVKGEWTPMNQTETNSLVELITGRLTELGFYKKPNKEEQSRFLRDIISRAGMSASEGEYFKEIFIKTAVLTLSPKNV